MEVKNLDSYFDQTILRRGYDYYKKGNVLGISKLENIYSAKIKGTENYEVLINLDINPYQMNCSCPYAANSNCKHMAAVLYCLKNDKVPVKEIKKIQISENITDFERFNKEFKKERYKLIGNKIYLDSSEIEEYAKLILQFVKKSVEYIKNNPELAYDILEYFLLEVDNINFTLSNDEYYYDEDEKDCYDNNDCTFELQKGNLISNIFNGFKALLKNEDIFPKYIKFIQRIYTERTDDFYYNNSNKLLELLFNALSFDWQAKKLIKTLEQFEHDKNMRSYSKQDCISKRIILTYKFIDKLEALKEAEKNLNLEEICNLMINEYQNDTKKLIDILKKIIFANDGWKTRKYVNQLLEIYKYYDECEYIKLLKEEFINHGDMEIYNKIKSYYSSKEWQKIKIEYLNYIKDDSHLYREICLEEAYYNELLLSLDDVWLASLDKYIEILIKFKPEETVKLYKKLVLDDAIKSNSRSGYQKSISYLKILLGMPKGKKEVADIIKYIRENYKNRKAFQEELDFFEDTYL